MMYKYEKIGDFKYFKMYIWEKKSSFNYLPFVYVLAFWVSIVCFLLFF